jgi:hypothetical protein
MINVKNVSILLVSLILFKQGLIYAYEKNERGIIYIKHINEKCNADLEMASGIMGIRLNIIDIGSRKEDNNIRLNNNNKIIITNEAIEYLYNNKSRFYRSMIRHDYMIVGLDPMSNNKLYKYEAGNCFKVVSINNRSNLKGSINIAFHKESITKELGGLNIPYEIKDNIVNGFDSKIATRITKIISICETSGHSFYPIFIKINKGMRSIYYLTSMPQKKINWYNDIVRIAPYLIFIRDTLGDYCWHNNKIYANFTIDDPWLREPYGNISFYELANDAEVGKYHVTIAFIPYNYKRSQQKVSNIFRFKAKYLSIAIHGNNHDFSEFRDSSNNVNDKFSLSEALHRMEIFKSTTGISYDRVMIFPRGYYTINALREISNYNFSMTVNSTRPKGDKEWDNINDNLRRMTRQYYNIPTVLRYGIKEGYASIGKQYEIDSYIRSRMFLGLPILIYVHEDIFREHRKVLYEIAHHIRMIRSNVIWCGLDNIAQNLYLQKNINKNEIGVLAYSNKISLHNDSDVKQKYIISNNENSVNNYHHISHNKEFESASYVEIDINAGQEKNITINSKKGSEMLDNYKNTDYSASIFVIRKLSDFRDIYISRTILFKNVLGKYRGEFIIIGIEILICALLIFALIILIGRSAKHTRIFFWIIKIYNICINRSNMQK